MAHQSVVTDYYTRKRQSGQKQAKRQKLITLSQVHDEPDLEKVCKGETKIDCKEKQQSTNAPIRPTSCIGKGSSGTILLTALPETSQKIPLSPNKRSAKKIHSNIVRTKRVRSSPESDEAGGECAQVSFNKPLARSSAIAAPKSLRAKKCLDMKTCAVTEGIKTSVVDQQHEKTAMGKCDKHPSQKPRESESSSKATLSSGAGVKRNENLKEDVSASVKGVLMKRGNLKDLQETLLKMNDLKRKHEAAKKLRLSKVKQHDDKADRAKEPKADNLSSTNKEYAYTRLHSLAQKIPKGLPLPFKYKVLQDMFKSSDTAVSMLFNRQETSTWLRVQQAVKKMLSKNFEKKHLGQIKHIFPDAYQYRQENRVMAYKSDKPPDYQLILEPILDSEECDIVKNEQRKFTSGMLLKRRHHFHLQLLSMVKAHHHQFLTELNQDLDVDETKIRRWHPQFMLDQVPDIPTADLPQPPDEESKRCSSAKEVLSKARDRLAKRAVDALKKVAESYDKTPEKSVFIEDKTEKNNNSSPKQGSPAANIALKGISQSLLAKIRAKEAEKRVKTMLRSDEEEQKIHKLRLLPEVAKSLRMLFVTEKKGSLPIDHVATKLCKSSTSISTSGSMDEHLRMLSDLLPNWLKVVCVGKQQYIKMDKNTQMSSVLSHLNAKAKEAEQH